MRSLVWFRRDLRVADNPALFHAALQSKGGVVGLFIITPKQWKLHDEADCKVRFWLDNVRALSHSLAKLRIPLLVANCGDFSQVPKKLVEIAQQNDCSNLFFNREYEVNEQRRDDLVAAQCRSAGIGVQPFHDRIIVPPREIQTKEGRFYTVFTPYRRVWDTKALDFVAPFARPARQPEIHLESSPVPHEIVGFVFSKLQIEQWKPSESESQKRLKRFSEKISSYDRARDIPSLNGTSLLSPYLAAGVISARQCMAAALAHNHGKIKGDSGATTWISELTWRDFYTHVMVGFPRVSMNQPFKIKTNAVNWRTSESEFAAWQQGRTGYPLVDAGMRQLNQTGWMHNRLRMVTAMFLTKHLLIDWRWGERYFMQRLIDGDLAANNGGWQWSASTGTDAAPYFRIFNPLSQSKRFDPDGKFIKSFCPELSDVPANLLHDADKLTRVIKERNLDYPHFMVDHKAARERTLNAFK